MGPLFPYITLPPLHILGPIDVDLLGRSFTVGELSIKPFGTLVAIGVYLGTEVVRRQGVRLGLDARALSSFVFYILVGGFVGGHVLDLIFYHPETVLASPLSLLRIWDGQSSFGGFTGAVLGLVAWRLKFQRPTLVYADVVGSALPLGWMFGRMGCSVAHDHPGMHTDSWFAVAYPGGARFDLGLTEMLLTIPLALAFLLLMRKPRPAGYFLGRMCVAYAPVRFCLDFLRARDLPGSDVRYAGLTPAQWGCIAMFAAGAYFAYRAARVAQMPSSEVARREGEPETAPTKPPADGSPATPETPAAP